MFKTTPVPSTSSTLITEAKGAGVLYVKKFENLSLRISQDKSVFSGMSQKSLGLGSQTKDYRTLMEELTITMLTFMFQFHMCF